MPRDVLLSLQAEARAFRSELASASSSLRRFSRQLQSASRAAARVAPSTARATASIDRMASVVTAVSSSISAASNIIRGFADIARTGFAAAQAAVAGTVGAFAEFDAGIRSIAAAQGTTDLSGLSADVTELGIRSEFTIGQVQQAALALAQLGATDQTLKPLLEASIKLAGVTKTDVATAAEIATKQMKSFGLSISDLPAVTTTLIQASTKSAATMQRLAVALQFAGPAAAGVGLGLRDVVPAIEALSDAGLEASIVGTTIRNVFTQLLQPTASAAKAIEGLGLSVADISPQSNDLITIIDKLGKAGLDAGSALAIFGKRFGLNTLKLAQLSREGLRGAEALRVYQRELGDVAEAEAKVATIRSGLDFSIRQLRASFEAARTQVGAFATELLGLDSGAADVATRVSGLVSNLSKLSAGEFREIVVKFIGQEDLSGIFERAVGRLSGPLFQVAGAALTFGARQLIRLAPLIGAGIAEAAVVAIIRGVPAIAIGLGRGITTILAGTTVAILELLAEVASFIPGMSGVADKIRSASGTVAQVAGKLDQGLANTSASLDKTIRKLTDGLSLGTSEELLGVGDELAEKVFGNAGTFRGMIDAGTQAGQAFAAEARAAVSDLERATGRGGLRAIDPGAGAFQSPAFGPLGAAIAGLQALDFSQRPGPVQLQIQAQLRQQQEAERRRFAAEQRARAEDARRSADAQRLASTQAVFQQAQAAGAQTVIQDNRTQTNYGVRAREQVAGPVTLTESDTQRTGVGGRRIR